MEDQGIGLEREDLESIFETFRRGPRSASRDEGGLGLGLPVARSLVDLHGGSLWAESEGLGEGAVFTFRLPLIDAEEAEESGPVAEVSAETTARRVLLVEDDPDAAQTLQRLLGAMGHEVTVLYDASSALQVVREERFDIVLCDLHLPGEMDGYALASAIREEPELADVRLVAVTGYGNRADQKRTREAGFEKHLTKPVEIDDLTRVMAT